MKPLPPALDGRYSVDEAVRIWLARRYGIDAPTARQRQAALGELKPVIRSETIAPARLPTRVRMPSPFAPPDWQIGGPDRPSKPKARIRRWIEAADLVAFLAEHGVDLVGDAKPASSAPRAKPGPKPKNDEAVAHAERLIDGGIQQTQAVMEAAERFGANKDSIERAIRRRRKRQ